MASAVRVLCCAFFSLVASSARADWMDHFVIRDDVGIHKGPYLGNAELLVMPVEVEGHAAFDRAKLETFFAADFVTFMTAASIGRYTPHVTVGPIIHYATCPLPAAQFPNCSVARGDIAAFTAGMDMIRDVVARTNGSGFDFSKLDVNGKKGVADGWADGVMLLTNVDFGGIAFPFGYYNRGDNLDGGTGGPLIVDGVKIGHVAIAGNSNTWVLIHEFSHTLGLTDLYAENQTYPGLQFSVMGAWGYDEKVPLHDAETRFRLRWGNWHQVQGEQKVVIAPALGGDFWRLGTGDEYFLVENRGPGFYDRAFTTTGLAVYHVDRRVKLSGEEGRFQDRLLDCVNCDAWHPYIMNLQGDGRFDLQTSFNDPVYEDDLFRDSDSLEADSSGLPVSASHQVLSSNWYSGQPSGIAIRDITVLPDGSISATLVAPKDGQCGETLCASGDGCAPVTCEDPNSQRTPKDHGCGCSAGPGPLLVLAALLLAAHRSRLARC